MSISGPTDSQIENKSFALLRTNPRLTSNIKVIVDSAESIYFGAFKANKELSKVEFQKYPIKSSGDFSTDIASFYKNMPNSLRYQVLKKNSDLTVYSDYAYQYETQYQYGATQNITKLYDEQYRIFAPIWLEKNTPTKFIVYRIEDVDYKTAYSENISGQNNRIMDLLNTATIIKTFDLSQDSEIGKYIYKHVNSKGFPNAAITFNFQEGERSTYNGIDIVKGGFASKAEVLDNSYTSVDYPEILNNETITKGFARNGIVSANIMNLEFLFDDTTASNYKIYRYFGIYADDIDEGKFDIENIDSNGIVSLNVNSYSTQYDLSGTTLNPIDMLLNEQDLMMPTLNYIKDKNGIFYHVRNGIENIRDYKLPISTNGASIELFRGFSKTGERLTSISKDAQTKGFIKITINQTPGENDRFFIGDKSEIEIENNSVGTFTFIATSTLDAGTFQDNKFSLNGSLQQVAIAISQSIKNTSLIDYNIHIDGSSIIIEDFLEGNKRRQTAFGIYNDNNTDFITINDADFNNIGLNASITGEWNIVSPIAGSSKGQMVYVSSNDIGMLQIGEYLKSKDSDNFSKIIEINQDPFDTSSWRVILDKPTKLANDNVFDIYSTYKVSHGKFAAYDFKDFDFDFYSTRNTDAGDLAVKADSIGNTISADPLTYFTWLTPVIEADNSNDIQNTTIIRSEYDRLGENELKDTALQSRVVPSICKFSLKDASNAKNFEYFLNANEAFGPDNMSPNIEISVGRNPEYLNMEHFHFNKIPKYYENALEINLTNYAEVAADGGLSIDRLTNIETDYFKKSFLWNGYYTGKTWNPSIEWIDNSLKINYSKFSGGSTQSFASTVFRGLRYVFKKRKEFASEFPTDFINSFDVNGYRFATILDYASGATENSVTYKVIKNDMFKFICVFIQINIVDNDILYLDRYNVYSEEINDITLGGQVIDTIIPFQIDFNASEWGQSENEPAIISASEFAILDGTADFEKYINRDANGEYSWILFEAAGNTYGMKVVEVIDRSKIIVTGYPYEWNTLTNTPTTNRMQPILFGLVSSSTEFVYFQAGRGEFSNLLEKINASSFANRFNKFEDIEYITVLKDGTQLTNEFVLTIESGTQFIKPSLITTGVDPEKPKAYRLTSSAIGKVVVDREDGGYITTLRRMNGDYNPVFNSVVTFTDIYSYHKHVESQLNTLTRTYKIYSAFNNRGIAFASYKNRDENYGYIKNYFYHKVNDENSTNILKLSQTTDKLPLYPSIGEIAIDKKDINLFKSKYSSDFFDKALPGGNTTKVHGTLSPIEKETFFASTIMKVKDSYDITSYSQTREESINTLNDILINELNETSIHWTEDDYTITADFYLPKAISNELKEDNIREKFSTYLTALNSFGDKTSIEDDLDVYIDNNITTRFIIDTIRVYGLEQKAIQTEFTSVSEVKDLTSDNYKELTNYAIQGYQGDALSFRLIYNKKPGYSYKLRVHIKIQA